MKRKILILLCAVCLVLSFSVTAFASSNTLPSLPEGVSGDVFVIETDPNTYIAYIGTNYTDNGTALSFGANDVTRYKIVGGGEWEYLATTSSVVMQKSAIVFDSTGKYLSGNLIDFFRVVKFDDFTGYYDGLKGQITVQNVVGVLVVGVGAVIGIVFMYWGIRKGVKALMSAFRKGKISL